MKNTSLVLVVIAVLILGACGSSENEDVEAGGNHDPLSDDELTEIESSLESAIETDRDDGFEYYLDKIDYEDDDLTVYIDIQQEPLPTKSEVIQYAEDVAWLAGEVTGDGDVNVSTVATTKFDEDEYVLYGIAKYKDGDTEFKEEDGMQLLE